MDHCIVCVSGCHKGKVWTIGLRPIIAGRADGCTIRIDDKTISRRHFQIQAEEGGCFLEDLGSVNPALVNGIAVKRVRLNVGDEIALGSDVFMVAESDRQESTALEQGPVEDTVSWAGAFDAAQDNAASGPETAARPRTVKDLSVLCESVTTLAASTSLFDFVQSAVRILHERFAPRYLWFAVVRSGTEMTFFDTGGDASDTAPKVDSSAPLELLERALREGRTLLLPRVQKRSGEKIRTFTLISPVVLKSANLAVLAMRTELPRGMFDERDLDLLTALSRSWAPILYAAQRHDLLERENEVLRVKVGESSSIVGNSAAIRYVREQLKLAASSDISVLITGETGTGKELAAREIHEQSPRRNMPMVIVNCAAIPKELFESELFGYEKGAFTGANQRSPGLVQQAHGGTLFLDEVGDLSIENQARILRLLENRTFRPLGGVNDIAVDVRFVAASNKDLSALIRAGAFREDLYHRLNGMMIEMPPLRERSGDVPVIAEFFLNLYRAQAKCPVRGFTAEATQALLARAWHGNVRELRNCIYRAVTVTRHDTIQPNDVVDTSPRQSFASSTQDLTALAEVEKRHITAILKMCNDNFRQAAKVLQIGRTTLYKKVEEYDIQV